MGLLSDLKVSSLWAKSLSAYDSQDIGGSVGLIEEMARIRPLKPFEIARLATNYVRLGRSDVARPLFEEAVARTADTRNEDRRYVNEYCKLFLRLMNENIDPEPHRDRISRIGCKASLKRWLPLR